MDSIKKTRPYLDKIYIILYFLSFIWLFVFLFIQQWIWLYILLGTLMFLGIVYDFKQRTLQKQLKHLIHNADAIVEQHDISLIDGEGDISLLSHKLYTLHKRYHVLQMTMQQEQIKLKDYIEDISHQLKTPITSMRINEELLLEVIENPKQLEKLQHIYQQTLKMNQLVNDLLTLALLDSNSIQFEYHDQSIEQLIEIVEENLDYLIMQRHMTIQLSHQNEIITCDQKWLSEAIENVIKNCLEKNHDSIIDIQVQDYDSMVKIIIQDHGEGFCEADIPHLFERFYRGQDTYKSQGVGIGLSLAKEIVDKHHGMIKAYNHQGAVFELTLPKLLAKKKL